MWPLDGINALDAYGFPLLWAASYIVHLALYFGLGGLLLWLNQHFPERQIPAISGRERKARRTAAEEIRQSLKSLAGTAFCLAAGVFAQVSGWTQAPLELSVLNVLWTFVAALILHDAWFYFGHRLMHTKPLYRWHKTHHLSVTPTVWNNDSFSVPDALSVQSFFILLPFILPMPTAALIALRLFDQTKGMIGHSGYEHFAGRLADIYGRRSLLIVAALFFLISAWGSGIASSSMEFVVYRILGGLAVGAASVMAGI